MIVIIYSIVFIGLIILLIKKNINTIINQSPAKGIRNVRNVYCIIECFESLINEYYIEINLVR